MAMPDPSHGRGSIGASAWAESTLYQLPCAIAAPLAKAVDTALTSRERLDWALYTAQQILRTLVLPQMAAYLLQERVTDDEVNLRLHAIYLPHFGDWLAMAKQLSKRLPSLGVVVPFGTDASVALDRNESGTTLTPYSPNYSANPPQCKISFHVSNSGVAA